MNNVRKAVLQRVSALTTEEKRDIGRANVFLMDFEMDGGILPSHIQDISDISRRLNDQESRILLKWFYETAPGDF